MVKPSGLGDFFFGNFKIMSSISLIVIRLFKWSVLYWMSYGSLYIFSHWSILFVKFIFCRVGRFWMEEPSGTKDTEEREHGKLNMAEV